MLNFIAPAHPSTDLRPGLARVPAIAPCGRGALAPQGHLAHAGSARTEESAVLHSRPTARGTADTLAWDLPAAVTPADLPLRRPAPMPVSRPSSLETPMTRWLSAMLDEIDYPMVLVNGEAQLLHANQVARADMDNDHPLQLLGDELRVLHSKDVAPLREALQAAQLRGLRRLLTLGAEDQPVTVAVVPMPPVDGAALRAVLLVLGKRQVCERLSAQWFAREHNLTPAETQVLDALCAGLRPQEVATQHGVAISTVRSQISSIRSKTGAQSIRALVRQVAVLPPLLNALRSLGRMNATVN